MRTTIIMARSRGPKTVAAVLGMVILTAGLGASQDRFEAKPANKYPAKQAQGDVIVAVKPFRTDKDMKAAFDKAEPYKYGFMPMLLVITNNSQHPLNLAGMKVRYIDGERNGLEPISGEDLAFFNPKGSNKPNTAPLPIPGAVWRRGGKKGPLAKPESVTSMTSVRTPRRPRIAMACLSESTCRRCPLLAELTYRRTL